MLKRLSYRFRLSLAIMLVAIIPIVIFFVGYVRSEKAKWEENALLEYYNLVESNSERLSSMIVEMKQKAVYIVNNAAISKALVDVERKTLMEDMDLLILLRDTVFLVSADNPDMKIHWYSDKTEKMYADFYRPMEVVRQDVQDESLLQRIWHLKNGEMLVVIRDKISYGLKERMICLYSRMNVLEKEDYLLEICVPIQKVLDMGIQQDGILGVQLTQGNQSDFYVLSGDTEEGWIVLENYLAEGDNPDYYEIVSSLDNTPGNRLICLLPQRFVASLIVNDWIRFVAIVVLVLVLVLLSAYAAVYVFTMRLNDFLNKVNGRLNDILVLKEGNAANDFAGIEKKIIQLVQDTREYCSELEKYEAENNRLELELLQMRFNPHFLYNTLIGIRYQIPDQEIRKSIDSLIRYYRIVLSKGHLIIRLEEEIEMIEEYLKLQLFTYRLSNIKYEIQVEDGAKDIMIIKHLLQPIVENALEHGVRAKEDGGNILIRVKLSEQDVIFEVEDNGVGMTPQQIKGVLEAPTYSSMGGGYGIYNVKQRVETYYGKEYGIDFHSKVGEGTLVVLRLPRSKGEKSEEHKNGL